MNQQPVSQTPSKKIYQQPKLKNFGDLRGLTQAGTKGKLEAGSRAKLKKL